MTASICYLNKRVLTKTTFWEKWINWKRGVAVLFLLQAVVNLYWLAKDRMPPPWDQAAHIRVAVIWQRKLAGESGKKLVEVVRDSGGYPPLIHFLGGGWAWMVGEGVDEISLANTWFLGLAMAGVGAVAWEVTGAGMVALAAVAIFSFFPVIYDISRNFLLDLPLTAWVVWGVWFYLKSEKFRVAKWAGWFGVAMALAALTKLNGVIYFGPMILAGVVAMIKNRDWLIARNLALAALVVAAGVGWWWVVNYQNIFEYLTGLAGQGEKLTDPMNLGEWQTWIHYFKLFFLHQAGPVWAIAAVTGWLALPKKGKWGEIKLFLVLNYVALTVVKNKDFRFTMPMLPLVAVMTAAGLEVWGRMMTERGLGRVVRWLGWGLAGYSLFFYVNNSFGWPVKKPFVVSSHTFLMEDIGWINISDYPVRAAKEENWPQEKIVGDLAKRSIEEGRRLRVLVLINREELNDNNLGLYRELGKADLFDLGSPGGRERFESGEEVGEFGNGFDLILVPEADYEPAPFYGVNLEAYKQLRDWALLERGKGWQVEESYQVFGDKKLYLMRKI